MEENDITMDNTTKRTLVICHKTIIPIFMNAQCTLQGNYVISLEK